jgi:hypothetical protein
MKVARNAVASPTPALSGLRETIIATTSWLGWRVPRDQSQTGSARE